MEHKESRNCKLCGEPINDQIGQNLFAEAGEWLAVDFWQDSGNLCTTCLENRGRLAMMYLHERNS